MVLAWATEAYDKSIITDKETMGIPLHWADTHAYLKVIRHLIEQPNEFYKALSRGVEQAASIYGGREFALSFGKNEMPGYHTGPGAYIGYIIGARHSHLDNAGYSVDQKVLTKQKLDPEELVHTLLKEEQWRQILSSCVICFFARGIYTPDIVSKALSVAGHEASLDALYDLGRKIHKAKYNFKIREGFSFDTLHIPERIYSTSLPVNGLDAEYIRRALEYAKKIL
ncbi:MAG: aldehyde ferredoxin oxidoreductase C-terminal domain-containing protein [bacterium]